METTGMHRTLSKAALAAVMALTATGCKTNAAVDRNSAPTAMAGDDQALMFNGTPVSVTLNGAASNDHDGSIAGYLWQPVDPSLGELPRTAMVTVMLGQGRWGFNLWVVDDDGAVSVPDQVVIAVGVPLEGPLNGTPDADGAAGMAGGGAGMGAGAGSPDDFMPDATCLMQNQDTNALCQACTCHPSAMGGCADEVAFCAANADATTAMLCKALLDCSNANMCSGSACYTEGCMMEIIDAALGDPTNNCDPTMPSLSGCAAASAITACKTANCPAECGL
jgi:hypothetical protein